MLIKEGLEFFLNITDYFKGYGEEPSGSFYARITSEPLLSKKGNGMIRATIKTLLSASAIGLAMVGTAQAFGVSGQGTWETTLLGRDINRNPVAATNAIRCAKSR